MQSRLLLMFVLTVSLCSCSGKFYNLPTPPADPVKYSEIKTDSVTTTGIMLFGFIPIQQNNKIERAIETLRVRNGGDLVTNVSIQERWFWAWVLNGYKTEVTATVLKKK